MSGEPKAAEANDLKAGFDKMVYRLDAALQEANELRAAIREFVAARHEHFRSKPDASELDVSEFNRTALRYEVALEALQRIATGQES